MLPLLKVQVRIAASQVPRDLSCGSGAGNALSQNRAKPLDLLSAGSTGCKCLSQAGLGSSLSPGLACGRECDDSGHSLLLNTLMPR